MVYPCPNPLLKELTRVYFSMLHQKHCMRFLRINVDLLVPHDMIQCVVDQCDSQTLKAHSVVPAVDVMKVS